MSNTARHLLGPTAPDPTDDSVRLIALRCLGVLDTPLEETFGRVTRLAAKALGVPSVLISLIDETGQWFQSPGGVHSLQRAHAIALCCHTVAERRPLVVSDTTLDRRFADDPVVTGEPIIRAYLGIPLHTHNGPPIGTLCAIDQTPRDFSADDITTLNDFAAIIQETIHGRALAARTNGVLRLATEQAKLFRETFEQAAVGIAHTAPSGALLRINQQACDMLGYTREELVAVSFIDITHPEDVARNTELFNQALAGTIDSYRMEKRFLKKDGSYLWVDLSVAAKYSADGHPAYMIAMMIDISAQKHAEAKVAQSRESLRMEIAAQTRRLRERNDALRINIKQVFDSARAQRQAENRLRSIANSMPAMIGYWNQDLRCEFANEAHREWFGRAPEQILGLTLSEMLGDTSFKIYEAHARLALAGHVQHFERSLPKFDGTPAFTDARYLPDVNEEGKVRGFYVLETDVTALREAQNALERANAKLTFDSATDYLTGLSNRRIFSERSEDAFNSFKADASVYGLILLDVDDFKRVNDSFGHQVGDLVLAALGGLIKRHLRDPNDVTARLGGEEFAVLCSGHLNADCLVQLAERIRVQIHTEIVNSSKGPVRFTASFGVALSLANDANWTSIYARADAALYEAKATGKDRVVYRESSARGGTGRYLSLLHAPNDPQP